MTKIEIRGAIVPNNEKWIYDFLEMDATSPKDIVDALPENNEDIEVIINSGGGDVFSGSEIYTTLKAYPGNVNIKIVGVAASAASVIAMAGTHVEMSPTAQMMIHNASSFAMGDYNEMDKASRMLSGTNRGIANAYISKTGKSEEEILDLMNKETWLNAQDAVEQGFADTKMFEETAPKLVANAGQMISEDAINKIAGLKAQAPQVNFNSQEIAEKLYALMKQDNSDEIKRIKEEKELKKPVDTVKDKTVKSGFGKFFF
ncbi:head maturation protease, ClpP-related [Staphylococcus petrasii]|uniref:head maturation protease, ClpP-related n=1 Tax=Staphylococcus petrasii TaxID=1276936 RepID=UPI001F587F32|nr:head maturation protease, ClpP-related [Staphylococcus petrasii]MCI2773419.1 Clp protease ClpP [Staphylococcus petrasii]